MHAAISSGLGVLLSGVLCLTTFVMNKSPRLMPFLFSTAFRNFPALPTKGLPVLSSSSPGFCPTSITLAWKEPSPGTAFLASRHNLHFLHFFICSFNSVIDIYGQPCCWDVTATQP